MRKEDSHGVANIVAYWVTWSITLASMIASYYQENQLKTLKPGFVFIQIRVFLTFLYPTRIMEAENKYLVMMLTVILFVLIVMNIHMFISFNEQHNVLISMLNCVFLILGVVKRVYGFNLQKKDIMGLSLCVEASFIILTIYIYLN